MKLKKIASLALAGVMAVSMLAGCKGGNTPAGGNGADENTAASIVTAVNNGQDIRNKVKVTFTTDAALETAAKKAVEKYQDGTTIADLTKAFKQYADLLGAKDSLSEFFGNENNKFMVGNSKEGFQTSSSDNDGDKVTVLNVTQIASSPAGEEYILNSAADIVNVLVGQLDDTDKVVKGEAGKDNTGANKVVTKAGDPYEDYSYTGKVCLFSVERSSGVTNYYLVTVIEQTVTAKTLEK